MKKRRKKESSPDREAYRTVFSERLVEQHGDVGVVAKASSSDPATVWSWRQPGEGLPDIFQLLQIAQAKGVSPAWLAFGQGPRDGSLATRALELGVLLERHPGLSEILTSYCSASAEDQAGIRWVAAKAGRGVEQVNRSDQSAAEGD